jgi:hypothetical protein
MKGTLFSADFIKDSNGNLRLLELNTDTGFSSGALHHMEFTSFIDLISTNNIDEVHVIYKELHKNFVNSLSQSLNQSGIISSFVKTIEEHGTIYPTIVEDSSTKFILRCAYDESAIFDSMYCKQKNELLKLFYDSLDTGSIAQFFISASDINIDTLERRVNETNSPDVLIKSTLDVHQPIKFYKVVGTGSIEDNFNEFIQNNSENSIIINYYDIPSEPIHKSIRSYNIIYGSNLDILNLGDVEVDAVFDKPTNISYNIISSSNLIADKHYFEFSSNYPHLNPHQGVGGIFEKEYITDVNGNPVLVASASIGESYRSIYVSGSPDTDNPTIFTEWTFEGSELPSGSYVTSSILVNSVKIPLNKNIISHITTHDSASFRTTSNQHLLVYDSSSNELKYKTVVSIDNETDYLLKNDGGLSKVYTNDIEVLEDEHFVYLLDLENVDTFTLNESGLNIKVIAHNACFPAGTKIKLENGDTKNIEDIVEGDSLVSFDTHNKKFTVGRVGKLNKSTQNDLVYLKTDSNHELKSTLGHKIYSNNKWVFAHELNVGDVLLDSDGNNSKIISLEIIKGEFEVYHILNVGSDHTYFSNGLLVHNFSFYGYGGPPPGYACFVSDTKVLMNDGSEKNIEDIVVGDEVLSYNEEKRLIESKKVINLKSPIHDDLVEYTLSNGIKITSTFDHPYYVNGLNLASYLPSKTQHLKELGLYNIENEIHQIKIGDFVNLADKQTAEIISIVELDRVDTQTYIISVEDNHNFYANQILVHNKI